MDYSATFARHFSRLISLLLDAASPVDEQKVLLRALVTVSKSGPVTLGVEGKRLVANERPVPGVLSGVQQLVAQLQAHSLRSLRIGAGARAADLLGVARLVAGTAATGDGGAQARRQLTELHAKSAIEIETLQPPKEAPAAPAEPAPPPAAPRSRRKSVADDAATLLSELTANDVRTLSTDELFTRLDAVTSPVAAAKVLDDVVAFAEHSARAGRHAVVGDIVTALIAREGMARSEEHRRGYAAALRKLTKPALLRGVAKLVSTTAEHRQRYFPILQRAVDAGAAAVVALIGQATTRTERQALVGMLKELPAAVPALVGMLDDGRWYAVRNAAELLGELGAADAEEALIGLVHHTDDRVRRAATASLLRIGTPNALRAVHDAVDDASPEVRMQAAAALSTKRDGRSTAALIRAVDDEQDGDVQNALIAALGRIGTGDAVQKLVKMAVPEGRLFRKKTNAQRIAAVQALGEARTPAAVAALKQLTDDKDREVRDTAVRALAQAGR